MTHLTRYEWQTARMAANAVLHLWIVRPDCRSLWILTPDQVRAHVPDDQGAGEWETVCIPFSSLTATSPELVDTTPTPTAGLLPYRHA
jgi:hypothetical protein